MIFKAEQRSTSPTVLFYVIVLLQHDNHRQKYLLANFFSSQKHICLSSGNIHMVTLNHIIVEKVGNALSGLVIFLGRCAAKYFVSTPTPTPLPNHKIAARSLLQQRGNSGCTLQL
jgi:hypothetical protein